MKQTKIKIIYRDGTEEEHCIDECGIKDGCLWTYIRFGVDSGTRYIPLDLIKEYIKYWVNNYKIVRIIEQIRI